MTNFSELNVSMPIPPVGTATPVSSAAPVVVSVQSAWYSKINWIAAITGLAAIIADFSPLLPPEYRGKATVAVTVLGSLSTYVARTFYTTSVTPSSVGTTPAPEYLATVMKNAGVPEPQITDALNAHAAAVAKGQAA